VVEDGRAHVLDLLAEAARAELIIEVPSLPWCFSFSHALVREVLYRGLDAQTRPALHGRIGEVLEAWHGPQVDLHLAQLAHHFFEAAGGGHGEQAIDYAKRAARRAVAGVAYDEAAAHYDRALRVLEIVAPEDAGRRARLLLALGGCRLRGGDGAGARASFEQVADIARVTRDPELLARAALGCGARSDPLAVNVHLLALLEEALRALGDRPSALRALVMARLARELGRGDRGVALAQNAVATAMQLDDRRVLTSVLIEKRFALWGPDDLAERLSEATLILQAAEAAGESETALAARLYRVIDLLELGQITDVDRELELLYRTAEDLRQPWYLEHAAALRSMRARLEGRYDDAERLAREALEIGLRIGDPSARTTYAGHALELARERGGLEGLEPELRRYAADYPTLGLVRYVPPWLHAELGHEAESRRELDRLADQDFTDVPRDMNWLGALALLAEACAFLGDASRAAILYERLRPYAPRIVVGGFGAICFGSLSLFLGKLAATASRWEEAIRHFEEALAENGRLGARPLVARTQLAYGFMLLDREAPGDTERGRALLAEASVIAERLGLTCLAAKAGTRTRPIGAPAPSADDAPGGEMVFSREGELWTIAYRGTVVRLRDTRGLRYLARLLGNPGRELLAVDVVSDDRGGFESLAGMSRGGGATVARRRGDAGDLLDRRAVAAYRTRLAEAQDELAEARRFNDVERAARLEAEVHALAGQLAQGVGLRGRRRKAGSYAERARLNVYKGIKAVLRKIAKANPALGHHLATTVRTGALCSYRPDPRVPAVWKIRGSS
jgi:tetratricopeptide (TPR) repeat protein